MLAYLGLGHDMKQTFIGAGATYESFDGRAPYKTIINEEMKIHPAPTDDKIMIPSSFSIIGVRPRFPRMVKIVTQEIEAEIEKNTRRFWYSNLTKAKEAREQK